MISQSSRSNRSVKRLVKPVITVTIVIPSREAKKANFNVAKGLEAQLLLAKGACVMLTANLWTEGG